MTCCIADRSLRPARLMVMAERIVPPGHATRPAVDCQWEARDACADSINAARSIAYRAKRKVLERYGEVV